MKQYIVDAFVKQLFEANPALPYLRQVVTRRLDD